MVAKIGRSSPRIVAEALERSERSTAVAYRRLLGPAAPIAQPILEATDRYRFASGMLASLTLVGLAGWLLGLWPSV